MATDLATASDLFNRRITASIEHEFRGGPAVNDDEFHFRHGWITVNGRAFNREDCFGYEPTYDGH